MKKFWVNLLAVLLLAALAMNCAVAEPGEVVILDLDSDVDVQIESTDDGIILDDAEMSLDIEELPVLEEDGDTALDLSQEEMETGTVPANNAAISNDGTEDFEIINGILVKYNGPGGDVVIPSGVTVIGEKAFSGCTNLTKVSIPNCVITIGENAFQNCFNLSSVTIPNSVTTINNYAFWWCYSLSNIVIPSSVTSIGHGAFGGCSGLTSVSISSNINEISAFLFEGCSSLTSIIIPSNVTKIDMGAFKRCSSLSGIIIPDKVTMIGYQAFLSCTSLADVSIGSKVASIESEAFKNCQQIKAVILPEETASVYSSAFENCYSLTNVTIKNGNTVINDTSFSGCPSALTFHTPCESKATKWAEEKGYTVIKSNHSPTTDLGKAPTCTETGLTDGSHCSVCGEIITAQQTIPATGHTPVTDPGKAPTCTEAGITDGSHCSVCKAIIKAQETIPATGHTPVTDPAVAPTIKKTGLTEGSHCSVCGEILVKQQTVPKLISVKKCKITGIEDAVYTGKPIQPAPVVKYNGKKLVKGVDYTVKYTANKAVGAATVTVTGIGKYGESVSKTFNINPRAVALSKLTAGQQQLTVTWKKGKDITGYEVQYGLKKSFAGAKTVAVKKTAAKAVLKKLTAGKTYYVRIRAYKTVKGKKYYSAWSKVKDAKVK